MKRYDPEADHYGGCDMCGAIMTEKKDGDYILFEDYKKEKSNGIKPELCDVLADMQDKAMDKNLCFRMFRDSDRSTEFITMYDVKEILSKYFT